jgi:hypothetical protein
MIGNIFIIKIRYGQYSAPSEVSFALTEPKWVLPSYYYTKVFSIDSNNTVQFIFFDSEPFSGENYPWILAESKQDRINWLNQTLINGDGKYTFRFFIQHHPLYSA